ncbi:TPA: 3-oxoadipate enol-lactonase [Pseudomonas aeruginosa]|nr:3-oxoadipate enol-lactonase [Pseudomonas aeruginosa]
MLNFSTHGTNNKKVLVMGSSLGTSSNMWSNLVDALAKEFYVVCFDTRGHGKSQHLDTTDVSVKTLANDVLEVLDHLDIEKFSYVGLSLGGAIGQTLAITHPERIEKLVLCCTAAKFGESEFWQQRANKVRDEGMNWLYEPTKSRWYTPGFTESSPLAQALLTELLELDPKGYAGICEAVASFDARPHLALISCPTLIIAGTEDLSTPVAVMQELANGIAHSEFIAVKGAAHIGNVEQPEAFLSAITKFI